jgi:hypothetical protein
MAVSLSALRTDRPLPQEDSWYSFLLEAEWTPGHSAVRIIRSIEKFNEYHKYHNNNKINIINKTQNPPLHNPF